jgi:hypothetical protein
VERQVKPRCADDVIRMMLVARSSLIEGRFLLKVVKPGALERWGRKGVPVVLAVKINPRG